jgi:predicted PurR-regulated permease PerM
MKLNLNREQIFGKTEIILFACGCIMFLGFLFLIKETISPLLLAFTIIFMLVPYRKYKGVKILLITVGILCCLWLVASMMSVFQPFIIGLAVAYLLNPLINKMEKRMNRSLAVAIVLLILCGLIALAFILLIPEIIKSLKLVLNPDMFRNIQTWIMHDVYPLLNRFGITDSTLRELIDINFLQKLQKMLNDILGGLLDFGIFLAGFVERVAYFFVLPFYIFYLLVDWNKMILFFKEVIPERKRQKYIFNINRIDDTFNNYLRTMVIISILNGIDVSIILTIFGVEFALIIGIISGILTLIPNFGLIVSLAINIIICLLGADPVYSTIVVMATLCGHSMFEIGVLQPKLLGKRINVHPALLILSIFVFASLFGFIGFIIGAPLTAILVAVFNEWKDNRTDQEVSQINSMT